MNKHIALAALAALCLAFPAAAQVYGPSAWVDRTATPVVTTDAFGNTVTTYPQLSGAYAITDQATYQAHIAVLAQYVVTGPLPAQGVLAGDDASAPKATVILHFADFATAQSVMTQVNGPVTPAPTSLPSSVPMYRVKIVMKTTASTHGGLLSDRVALYIATLTSAQQLVANELWADAPGLDPSSDFAQGFKAFEGLTDTQWSALIAQAVGLPL